MNMRNERCKLRIKNHLLALGRVYESEMFVRVSNYTKAEYKVAVEELIAEGFIERTERNGANILVLANKAPQDPLQPGVLVSVFLRDGEAHPSARVVHVGVDAITFNIEGVGEAIIPKADIRKLTHSQPGKTVTVEFN